ncbi:M81 family metallopeptidase [Enterobacter hormaechei]|uniref:M81 family metallopeptidase n=1 Tax=Enterobacter hormaechei TaxID=158836 RepID=UPI00390815CA
MYKILIGQIFQETHGFTPLKTELESFEIELGEELIMQNINADSTLGGMLRAGKAEKVNFVSTIAARTSPGGKVTDRAFEYISDTILAGCSKGGFDAVILDLHGCMQTESHDSAETELIRRIRESIGPGVPVVIGLDLHAYVTADLVRSCDFITCYKTNPHGDTAQTGMRAMSQLLHILKTGQKPLAQLASLPMLTRGNDETSSGPLFELHRYVAGKIASVPGLIDASVFNIQQFVDGTEVGQKALVYSTAEAASAARNLATQIVTFLWEKRDALVHNLPSLADVVKMRRESGKQTWVLGDFGDRVLAGGPGDSVHIPQQVAEHPEWELSVLSPVTSPEALKQITQTGAGKRGTFTLGGEFTEAASSFTLEAEVISVGNGSFRNRGAFMRNARLRIGPYAVIRSSNITMLVTREPLMSQDPGCYLDTGINPGEFDLVVAKSGYHYKLAFSETGECCSINSPGLTSYQPEKLGLEKARPIYPVDMVEPDFVPVTFE